MEKAASGRIAEIDGLRGWAILSVAVFHWVAQPLAESLPAAWSHVAALLSHGVDLFFVISGFLIGQILLKIQGRGRGIRAFYLRRILRIWVPYYLLLLAVSLLTGGDFARAPGWSFPLFVFNFWGGRGDALHPALYPLWSIAIEEQFYAVGPLLFSFLSKKRLAFFLLAYLLAAPLLRGWISANTEIGIWEFTFTRLDGISAGLLLALLFASPRVSVWLEAHRSALSRAALFFLILPLPLRVWAPASFWNLFGVSAVTIAFAALLAWVHLRQKAGEPPSAALRFAWLRWLGLRCYSIYLFHMLFMYLSWVVLRDAVPRLLAQSALTLVFAQISWRYLEAPLMRIGRRFSYDG